MMATPAAIPLHTIPIASRPPPSLPLKTHRGVFALSFILSLVVVHLFQLVALPLALLAPRIYRNWILHSKEAFASLLLAITVSFAGGSEMVLTAGEGVNLDDVCKTDASGNVVALNFEKQTGEFFEDNWSLNARARTHACLTTWQCGSRITR